MGHFMFLMLLNITKKSFMLIQHKLFGTCVVIRNEEKHIFT